MKQEESLHELENTIRIYDFDLIWLIDLMAFSQRDKSTNYVI